jgi:hypothetical protein
MASGPDIPEPHTHLTKERHSGAAHRLRLFAMQKKNDNSGKKHPARELIEIQAVADDNNKRRGEAAEAAFLARACSLRLAVCRPWGDSERYDLVVDHGKGFWRVQVKSTSRYHRGIYRVKTGDERPFTREDMDFVVAHVVPENVWYIVPIEAAEGRTDLCVNPRGKSATFEKYREAWCLLDCPRRVRGWNDIPVQCRSEEVGARCAVCPLREMVGSTRSNRRSNRSCPSVIYKSRSHRKDAHAMKRKASKSHDEAIVRELRDHPDYAADYLRAALEDDDEPNVLLIALRHIAEARGALPRWRRPPALSARVCIAPCRCGGTLDSLPSWP